VFIIIHIRARFARKESRRNLPNNKLGISFLSDEDVEERIEETKTRNGSRFLFCRFIEAWERNILQKLKTK
jgi:hypothetical protein